jgi:UDP-N-acetylglucosamine transferase subunit ALG13
VIFLTVGSQLPFDRLVRTVDELAFYIPQLEVVAQIGATEYKPNNITHFESLIPEKYEQLFNAADFVISHAGMGTIISSLSFSKPLLVMPRRAEKGEHRNDHQLMTVKQLTKYRHIKVAQDEDDLRIKFNYMMDNFADLSKSIEDAGVSQELILTVKNFANPKAL